ncbi:peptide-methionine (S)-S-oxide reductase MsrA [Xylophilus sp. GOD-11R]|uniref:peptide-methionine (S)-S-oxide reductase MsrA n=1 Tax=Xylophilus sp. GOD-11R TaxID=3089814 RepID=UPI00298C05BA|nr:peptide-methionine (S)-S-oxide reductase MsrA [Xylophilus sp. GOD-11R]WPB58578.1 peptide-methionine (S)-S-oxide reductase MsrA [Xylophilus sp. GOD-11R]
MVPSRRPARSATPSPSRIGGSKPLLLASVLALAAWTFFGASQAAEEPVRIPPPAADMVAGTAGPQTVVFAGGCFWGVQGVFQHTRGVLSAVSGYAGGAADTAQYTAVSGGRTGHAEAVQVTFDPQQVSYGKLMQIYFSVAHDPTQRNRQGPDIGTQYRSAIFYATPAQQDLTRRYIAQLDAAKAYTAPIATEVAPLKAFYPAEAYHQDYATLHPTQGYIATYDLPKIAHLKALMPELYREQPVLVKPAGA